ASSRSVSNQAVAPVNTTVSLLPTPPTPPAGKTVFYTATVASVLGAPTPTGTLTLSADGVPQPPVALAPPGRAPVGVVMGAGTHTIVATFNGSTNFRGSANTLTQSVVSPNQSFVYQVYRDVLRREVDPFGLQAWTALLDAGAGRDVVVRGILSSNE